MKLIENRFKKALMERRQQIGLWCTFPGGYMAEVLAGTGFDWILFDTEHSPMEAEGVLGQLQAAEPYPVSKAVRAVENDTATIKRLLDMGAQTLMLPYIQSAEEAQAAVSAMRYGPLGVRGMAGLTRATRFGKVEGYAKHAHDELCLIVQVETAAGIEEIEKIAAIDGVDGIFIGPADLAATMGYPGEASHPKVKQVVEKAIGRIIKAGKPAGILTLDKEFTRRCIELGTTFTAVGVEMDILIKGCEALAREFKG